MLTVTTASPPVHRHAQDTQQACGRACAQMVVASLVSPTPANTAAVLTQDTLRLREDNKFDITDWWSTEPGELLRLLTGAAELAAPDKVWRPAIHPDRFKLLGDLHLALSTHQKPGLVTSASDDHWLVLNEIQIDSNGSTESMVFSFLDPLPTTIPSRPSFGLPPFTHTYADECSRDGNGQLLLFDVATTELGSLDFMVGQWPVPGTVSVVSGDPRPWPAAAPVGVDLATFENKFAGVAFGPAPPATVLSVAANRIRRAVNPNDDSATGPIVGLLKAAGHVEQMWSDQIQKLLKRFKLPTLQFVMSRPGLDLGPARLVRDYDGPGAYVLRSARSEQAQIGLIAVFGVRRGTPLLHCQIVNDERLHNSLLDPDDKVQLWWGRRRPFSAGQMHFPYFPYRRTQGGTFTRLYDERVVRIL